ncbi:hypothetical protein LptCag_0361 [Leptospirillum ferriphilum]|uniref:Uncharacterized protein n=1 Tax=Leptospirillum ferriphilum TaxID=178606 RepID=A0A094W9X5_9BACT|nr:hypothetical protein LptCag_0361 [Leptospirillum ferriphilum]
MPASTRGGDSSSRRLFHILARIGAMDGWARTNWTMKNASSSRVGGPIGGLVLNLRKVYH